MPIDDGNGWSLDGRNILSPERMATIQKVLEDVGPIILEHWFYYGSRSPERLIFDDFEELEEYLSKQAKPGDAFHIWDYAALCLDDNTLTDGKYPDAEGRVPARGAY
jgi:hypothetical protein